MKTIIHEGTKIGHLAPCLQQDSTGYYYVAYGADRSGRRYVLRWDPIEWGTGEEDTSFGTDDFDWNCPTVTAQ